MKTLGKFNIVAFILFVGFIGGTIPAIAAEHVNEQNPAVTAEPINEENAPVKKSKSGICHPKGGSYYKRTKIFTPYLDMETCLKSGGRRPKR